MDSAAIREKFVRSPTCGAHTCKIAVVSGLRPNSLSVDASACRTQKVQVGAGQAFGRWQGSGIFSGVGRLPHCSANGAGIDAVHPDIRVFQFVRQSLRQPLRGELGATVGAPVGAALIAHTAGRENRGGVFGATHQGQQAPREDERRIEVDVHHTLPQAYIVVLDRTAVTENAGVVEKSIEFTEARLQLGGQVMVVLALGEFEIECRYGRARDRVRSNSLCSAYQGP